MVIYWESCEKLKFQYTNKDAYTNQNLSKKCKTIQTDHPIPDRRPDQAKWINQSWLEDQTLQNGSPNPGHMIRFSKMDYPIPTRRLDLAKKITQSRLDDQILQKGSPDPNQKTRPSKTDHPIQVRKPDLALINMKKRTCHIVDFAGGHRVKMKGENLVKYSDLTKGLKKLWHMKVTVR